MEKFENIYQENYPEMFRIAKKIVSDGDVAGDIVQEVFVYYFEKMQDGFVVFHPRSWLVRAVVNKCMDHLNRRKKYAELSAANELTAEDENMEIQKQDAILKQAIAKLKPLEKKIIVLYSEGYSYKEIAQTAEMNVASVGKTLSRTLLKLKEILKGLNYEMY
ncbi:MAG: sigma-70 family RNA polymerase sigma factor [Tannerella sp.]|nr:sigma-70 family RNA polymerase sigma factor [Tannerella sp.]